MTFFMRLSFWTHFALCAFFFENMYISGHLSFCLFNTDAAFDD